MRIFSIGFILLVSVSVLAEEEVGEVVTKLVLRDEMNLKELEVLQNADDIPLKTRALAALHWFRRGVQPSNPNPKWQQQLDNLKWLREDLVRFPADVRTGLHPNDNGASQTMIIIHVINENVRGDGWIIYVGFSDSHNENDKPYRFLHTNKGKVVYLGLIHDSGFWENYTENDFWISYTGVVTRPPAVPEKSEKTPHGTGVGSKNSSDP